jgi:hypothetical protein
MLVDWHAASADRPDLFWRDGYHLRPQGAQVYADLVAASHKTPESANRNFSHKVFLSLA